jgi:hypothetical protein
MAPLGLHWPWYFWAGLGFILILLLSYTFVLLRRRWQKKKLVADLLQKEDARSPQAQFHLNVRALLKREAQLQKPDFILPQELSKSLVEELDQNWKHFLVRTFKFPAHVWNDGLILKEFKNVHSEIYKKQKDHLRRLLTEIKRAQVANQNLKVKDFIQLLEEVRQMVDVLSENKGGKL